MGTNFKAALLPPRVRETIHGWGKEAKRRRRRGLVTDESTTITTVGSSDDTCLMTRDEIYGDRFSLSDSSYPNGHIGTTTSNSIEIELQAETRTSVAPYSDSHIHTMTQQRSLSLLPSHTHEPTHDAINFARSFTQPISRH